MNGCSHGRAAHKVGTYFGMHLSLAALVAFAITGSLSATLAIGLIEPGVQAIAYAVHEYFWGCAARRSAARRPAERRVWLKTISYFHLHVLVAVAVVYTITRDAWAALSVGTIEPAVQMVGYHLHERFWSARQPARTDAEDGSYLA